MNNTIYLKERKKIIDLGSSQAVILTTLFSELGWKVGDEFLATALEEDGKKKIIIEKE
jgi:hypothetical protein